MNTVKPGFFIVGAAKAGTTSLNTYLSHCPDIYFSPIKEPNYFSTDIDPSRFSDIYRNNNLIDPTKYFRERKLKELHLAFVRKEEQYARLFEAGQNYSARGECSTSYLYSQIAAKNIFSFNPESKIIVLLRNPAERAFSHYLMAYKYGYTNLPFRDALEQDMNRREKGWGISELYYELGCYYEQLNRYYRVFPTKQILVLLFDDLKDNPDTLLAEILDFLGLPPFRFDFEKKAENKANIPRSKGIARLANSRLARSLKSNLPKNIQSGLKNQLFESPGKAGITLSETDRKYLLGLYKEDIKKTAELTGKDLSHWLV